jgi:uncharacterized RDD family membrane protein YckC
MVVVILLMFGFLNKDIVESYTINTAFERGGALHLFYDTNVLVSNFPEVAVHRTTSGDAVNWGSSAIAFSNSCVIAPLDCEIWAFFEGEYSVCDADNLLMGEEAWKSTGDYPNERSDAVPLWAGAVDNTGVLLLLESASDKSMQISAMNFGRDGLKTPQGNSNTIALFGTLRADYETNPGAYCFTAAVFAGKCYMAWRLEDEKSPIFLATYGPDGFSAPDTFDDCEPPYKGILKRENFARCDRNIETTLKKFALGVMDEWLVLAGIADGPANEIRIMLFKEDLQPLKMWSFIKPAITGIMGEKTLYDIAIATHAGKPVIFVRAGSSIYSAKLDNGLDARFHPVVKMSAVREALVMAWLGSLLALAAGMTVYGIVLAFRIGRRRMQHPLPPAKDISIGPVFHRSIAFITDVFFCGAVVLALGDTFNLFHAKGVMSVNGPDVQLFQVFFSIGLAVYSFAMESLFGWTIGKRILKMSTASQQGGRASLYSLFLRNTFKLLVPQLMFLDMIVFIFSTRNQRLGDLVAGTVVTIERSKEEHEEEPGF